MGTRSLVHFEEYGEIIASVYRQFDGYFEVRGHELATFLSRIIMRNGFGGKDKAGTHANGMGCLAAQWIKFEKEDIGGVYLQKPGLADPDDIFIEYQYVVSFDEEDGLLLKAWGHDDKFHGTPQEFLDSLDEEQEVA